MRLLGIPPTDSPTFGWVATPAGTILTPVAATITDLTTWASIQGKPAVVAAGVDAAAARGVIGAEATANKGVANGYASLDSGGKVPANQLPANIMEYMGTWNASTNTPALADGTAANAGQVYRVAVGATRNLGSGNITFDVGDYAVCNAAGVWEKSDTTDSVASVNGYTGTVALTKSDVGLANVDNTSDATKNSATATLTNKTLTDPKIETIRDNNNAAYVAAVPASNIIYVSPNGRTAFEVQAPVSAANQVRLTSAVAGGAPLIAATGTDTDVSLNLQSKGAGGVYLRSGTNGVAFGAIPYANAVNYLAAGNAATGAPTFIAATGSDANINIDLRPKGAGSTTQNGVPFVTTSGTQTLTNKSLTASQVTDFNTAADARVVAGITGKENTITAGTTAQYWRGDKTWQTLNSAAVGLGNVDNTSDATKWAATKTLTNTRVTERVGTTASSATPSIDCNSFDQYNITALAVAITSVTVTGTPTDGQRLMVRIKDNGTARALAWGASFVSSGSGTLPTTTVANKTHLVGFIYDSAAAKWVCVAADAAGY